MKHSLHYIVGIIVGGVMVDWQGLGILPFVVAVWVVVTLISNWIERNEGVPAETYELSELTAQAWCGLCGKVMLEEIVPKDWPWSICHEH